MTYRECILNYVLSGLWLWNFSTREGSRWPEGPLGMQWASRLSRDVNKFTRLEFVLTWRTAKSTFDSIIFYYSTFTNEFKGAWGLRVGNDDAGKGAALNQKFYLSCLKRIEYSASTYGVRGRSARKKERFKETLKCNASVCITNVAQVTLKYPPFYQWLCSVEGGTCIPHKPAVPPHVDFWGVLLGHTYLWDF